MSAWFFMLGKALVEQEKQLMQSYVEGLSLGSSLLLEGVVDWNSAAAVISNPEWDRSWWNAEQTESDRLRAQANSTHGASVVTQALSVGLVKVTEAAHAAAAAEASRGGCDDAALIRVAAGAVSQALYLAELARLAGEGCAHPFLMKKALFESGHWPLCVVNGRFYIF